MKARQALTGLGLLIAAIGLAVGIIACSDDENGDSNGEAPTTAIPETRITARDFSFDAPATLNGGLQELTLVNQGQEPHHAQVVRLNDGVTAAQFRQTLQSPDPSGVFAIVTFVGGPSIADPSESATVSLDLGAGQHAILCFVEGADGVPHLAKGMVKDVKVEQPSAARPQAPESDATIRLADYSFVGADALPAGKSIVEVENAGPQVHEMSLLRLEGDLTFQQLSGALTGTAPPPPGPPPITYAGGMQALAVGRKGWAELDLTPGTYAFVCFVPDQTGKPHVQSGMIKQLTVR